MSKTSQNKELLRKVAERFRALGDETRIRILLRLSEGECNVSNLSKELNVGQASVSKHLATLRHVGFLKVRRDGAQSFYTISDDVVMDLFRMMSQGVIRHHSLVKSALEVNEESEEKPPFVVKHFNAAEG